ncbi:MAG: hypothetical protein Q8Q20_00950 [bacterium]|nr:hypothetical protein [bacterium]
MKHEISTVKIGVAAGLLEGVFISVVAVFMRYIEQWFKSADSSAALSSLAFLFLFVFSAGISALVVFGYPMFLVLKNKFHEAVLASLTSLGTLLGLFFIVLFIWMIVDAA